MDFDNNRGLINTKKGLVFKKLVNPHSKGCKWQIIGKELWQTWQIRRIMKLLFSDLALARKAVFSLCFPRPATAGSSGEVTCSFASPRNSRSSCWSAPTMQCPRWCIGSCGTWLVSWRSAGGYTQKIWLPCVKMCWGKGESPPKKWWLRLRSMLEIWQLQGVNHGKVIFIWQRSDRR